MSAISGFIVFALISLSSAALALCLTGWLGRRSDPDHRGQATIVFADTPRRYEFREGYLLSPLDPNDVFLPAGTDRAAAFDRLREALSALHPDLRSRLQALVTRGEAFVLTGTFGPDALSLSGRMEKDRLILTLGPTEAGTGRQVVDDATLTAMRVETEELRAALDTGGVVMWKQGDDGAVVWANAAYFALVEQMAGPEVTLSWPLPTPFAAPLAMVEPGTPCRVQLTPPDADAPFWFEVSLRRLEDGGTLFAALDVNRLVAAENSRRTFVQTLAQTFAHLPTGLAIFDRQRELVLFNPALVSLSTIGPELLSNRPRLTDFLDALRERQRMPEPRDYRSWRHEIERLEQGAENGSYHEVWTLPGGQSYRVIGRPHPDGALALMFEDISSEMSLTRQFRGELDLYQSVLDDMPWATAVFSNAAQLVLSNRRYAKLWEQDPSEVLGLQSLADVIEHWRGLSHPTDAWDELRRVASGDAARQISERAVRMRDGRVMTCRMAPMAGGATSVSFFAEEAFAGPQQMCAEAALADPIAGRVAPPVPRHAGQDA